MTTQRYSTLQSTLSRHQNNRARQCRGVSGSLARLTSDLDTAASRRFPMNHGDSRCSMCSDFFPACCSGCTRCSHSTSITTRVSTMRPSRTWSTCIGMFHRPLLKAATHHRYIVPTCAAVRRNVHPASCRPTIRRRSNGRSC